MNDDSTDQSKGTVALALLVLFLVSLGGNVVTGLWLRAAIKRTEALQQQVLETQHFIDENRDLLAAKDKMLAEALAGAHRADAGAR